MDKYLETPLIGMRTAKSVLAVIVTAFFMKYVLHQTPFFACIGAVVAVERTFSHSIRAALIRNIGTITGGIIGIAVSILTQNMILLALGLIPMIYINNILGKKESIVPGAIVYFAVVYLNTSETAFVYGFQRILGTLIGTLIGFLVNVLVFPPKDDKESVGLGGVGLGGIGVDIMRISFNPFPVLVTQRLNLVKPETAAHAGFFLNLRGRRDIADILDRKAYADISEAEEFLGRIVKGIDEDKWVNWIMVIKDTQEVIGSICLWNIDWDNKRAEIGYEMLPEYEKKGYMSEAIKTVLEYGFTEMKMDTIFGTPNMGNEKSVRLLENNGFTCTGSFKTEKRDGGFARMLVFEIKR